jgi:hypothetical protein
LGRGVRRSVNLPGGAVLKSLLRSKWPVVGVASAVLIFGCAGRSERSSDSGGGRSALVELERALGSSFCDSEGLLVLGRVESDGTGALTLSGIRHLGWEDPPTCPSAAWCSISEEIEPVVLSGGERDELEHLIGRLPPVPCDGNLTLDCFPCFTTRIAADGASHDSNGCVRGCDEPALAVDAIAEYLDALAAR